MLHLFEAVVCIIKLEFELTSLSFTSVDVTAVKTVQQKPGSDFVADTNFNSQSGGDDEAVLEIILDVTLSYYPPEPDGWRDWSIYLKSWIESFGNTVRAYEKCVALYHQYIGLIFCFVLFVFIFLYSDLAC